MDPFKMGFRNLIGITAPGAIIVLTVIYGGASALVVLGKPSIEVEQIRELQWLMVAATLLLSYLIGSVLRLHSADDVDAISSRSLEDQFLKSGRFRTEDIARFSEVRQQLLSTGVADVPPGFDQWLWSTEVFPYPAW